MNSHLFPDKVYFFPLAEAGADCVALWNSRGCHEMEQLNSEKVILLHVSRLLIRLGNIDN